MTTLTTTVKFDTNGDGTYDLTATSDVLSINVNYGRTSEKSQPAPGTCTMVLDNSAGTYSPRNSGLRPLYGVQVVSESQNIFHGFIRRIYQHPSPHQQQVIVDCADWLWILSRTDVVMPLYTNVPAMMLAHRIADFAEVGEHVDNPRWRDDTTDYSAIGAATITRATTGYIFEGKASLDVTGLTGTSTGVRYAIPHSADSDFQSKKVTASAYVWSEDGNDYGEIVTIRLADNTTTYSGTNQTLWSWPSRVATSATFAAGATDFYIDIIGASVISAEAVRVGAVHCVTSTNAIPRSFGQSQVLQISRTHFPFVAPHRRNALRAIQECAENELGGLAYVDEAGNLTYEDQAWRWTQTASTTSNATFDETMLDIPLEESAEDLVGEVEIGYSEWDEGDPNTVVFQLYPAPRTIAANASITFDCDYGALVRSIVTPVANTDYYIRSSPSGDTAGADETGNVTLTFDDFGEGAQVTLANTVARTVYLTTFKIRGTPVRASSDNTYTSYTPTGAPAIASKLRYRYDWLGHEAKARTWAEYLGDRYVTQRERVPVTLINKDATLTTQQTTRKISDRVTLVNDNANYSTKLNGDYYIDSIKHKFSEGATKLETKWNCIPVDLDYAIWDSDSWDDASAPWAP